MAPTSAAPATRGSRSRWTLIRVRFGKATFPTLILSGLMLRLVDALRVTTTRSEEGALPPPLDRFMSESCDPSLALSWLSICRDKHGHRCIVSTKRSMATLRLVDVDTGIVDIFSQANGACIPAYVTLSWVWVSARGHDGLTLDRLPHSCDEGFVSSLQLPPSVLDAIELVRQLGIRYLWVDLLCIIQNSVADKDIYIPLMGLIYAEVCFFLGASACSFITLIHGFDDMLYPAETRSSKLLTGQDKVMLTFQTLSSPSSPSLQMDGTVLRMVCLA